MIERGYFYTLKTFKYENKTLEDFIPYYDLIQAKQPAKLLQMLHN